MGDASYVKGTELNGGTTGTPCRIDVKDGRLLRIQQFAYDWRYDSATFNKWKLEVRGHTFEPNMHSLPSPFATSYKNRVYSPNRVLYPLKRVDWDPDGERNTQNRGKSGYVRISWDKATDLIAKELKRVGVTYGPEAVLCQADMHGEGKIVNVTHGCPNKLLSLLGGYTIQMRNMDSWEGWAWGAKHVWGAEPMGEMVPADNLIPDVSENTEMILFWGCDPEVTPLGLNGMLPSRLCYWFTQLGIKCVYICPDLNYAAGVHADKWIPIKPSTDSALQLAIAYIWMTEDIYDKDYVATHTYGFEKFGDYVLGKKDGVPKTPAWASKKCGIPVCTIIALAREWASKRTSIAHGNGGGCIRGPYSTEHARLEVFLLAMQGLGKPGVHQFKMIEWMNSLPRASGSVKMPRWAEDVRPAQNTTFGDPSKEHIFITPSSAKPELAPLLEMSPIAPQQFIPKNLIHDAILNPPISWYGNSVFCGPKEDQFFKYTYPAEGCSEIHAIWTDSPCWITCWNDSNSYIKALRSEKIEFIVAQHPWMENDCLLADIVLPISTKYEEYDIGSDGTGGQFDSVYLEKQCLEPLGESVSDFDAVCRVAEKLGLLEEYTGGADVAERVRLTFENSGLEKLMTFEEFCDRQYYIFPTDPNWKDTPAGLYNFYKDPQNHPLRTPTGKLEFCSTNLERYFPDDKERPPVPHWIEKGESHDNAWCREAPTCKVVGKDGYAYEPCWLNPKEAKKRGIKHGDIIKVYNDRGTVLAGAYVTERLNTDTAYMDHGARYDPIIPGEVDRGGAINTITPHNKTSKNVTGMVVSSFLVEVAKVTDEEMAAWRRINPRAFDKPYSQSSGLCLDSFLATE
jgi:trimethylamine-N-oxide reductase (cytochrome c)